MRSRQLKRKRHSCAMCKPHKMGGSPKDTNKHQAMEIAAIAEVKDYDPDELVEIHALLAADAAMTKER